MEISEIDIYELISDKAAKIIKQIIEETEKELKSGKPYHIIRKRYLQRLLHGTRGLQFIIKQLKKRYRVIEDGSWYILYPQNPRKQ